MKLFSFISLFLALRIAAFAQIDSTAVQVDTSASQMDTSALYVEPLVQADSPVVERRTMKIDINPFGLGKQGARKIKTRWVMLDFAFSALAHEGDLNMPNTDGRYDLRPLEQNIGKSTAWTLWVYKQRIRLSKDKRLNLYHGLGFDFMLHNFSNRNLVLKPGTNQYEFSVDTQRVDNNRLYTSYVQIPIWLNYETNPGNMKNSFRASLGVYGGLLLGSNVDVCGEGRATLHYKDDFNLNRVKYGITGYIGYGYVNFFANYSLSGLFANDKGPNINVLNIGVQLLPF